MLRFGILSTAKIGREKVIPAILKSRNAQLAAIASRDQKRAEALADRFGAPFAFGSYEAMLASPEIDAVYIPLVTSEHMEWSLKAAEAGKHVLCEKPMALHADDFDLAIGAAKRNQVVISEAFMVYYHPQWAKVRELLATGAIGELKHVDGAFTYFLDDPNNMRNQPALGGGGLYDIGVYPTITTRFATGQEPLNLRAKIDFDPEFGTDRFAQVHAEFAGFSLEFYISTQMALRQSMVFHGTNGWIDVKAPFNAGDYGDSQITIWNSKHDYEECFRFAGIDQYQLQIEAFAEAVAGQGEVMSLENSKCNQRVIDACFLSNKENRIVEI